MNSSTQRAPLILSLAAALAFAIFAINMKHPAGAQNQSSVQQNGPMEFHDIQPADTLRSFPTVMIEDGKNGSVPLGMEALKVDIRVTGNIAVTTLDMTFFNREDRLLEGQLYFPLGAGQTVSDFAMDVDGKLRHGVVVEKKEARVAYESTIRQNIDPGLLEWTKGNNFKARIYPIPAKGSKRIVVSYTQELRELGGQLQYYMPMKFKDKLRALDVKIEVVKQAIQPVLKKNSLHTFEFDEWEENYKAEKHLKDIYANEPLAFWIPFSAPQKTLVERGDDGKLFFYTVVHPQKGTRLKKLPKSLSLVWDVSGSAKGRDLEKELSLLTSYLKQAGNVTVELITFSNEIHGQETFKVRAGDCEALCARLREQEYDGGTQLGSIDLKKLTGEEVILSSDCLNNFGDALDNTVHGKPVHVWNSIVTADHSNAQFIADKSHGQYIDLTALTAGQAVHKMRHEQLRFLGTVYNPDIAVTTDRAHSFTENFSIAGTTTDVHTQLALKFGYGNEVTEVIRVALNEGMTGDFNGMTPKIWAQKRIAELDLRYEQFKDEITELGKKYGIVTRNTSLLILDRVEDYVAHRITPPAELRKAYDKQIAQLDKQSSSSEKEHMETVVKSFAKRKSWWNKKIIAKKPAKIKERGETANISAPSEMEYAQLAPLADEMAPPSGQQHDVSVMANSTTLSATSSGATYSWTEGDGVAMAAFDASTGTYAVHASTNAATTREVEKAAGSIQLKNWDPSTPYIKKLKAVSKGQRYKTYLKLKKDYENQPSYYIDVADFFIRNNDRQTAMRILSNIAELELENPQLLRILGHRLEQLKYYDLSISVFREVKNLRPEEPQSYRDLGLVYALNNEKQKAVNELYYVVSHSWDGRFSEIESLVAMEMNAILATSHEKISIAGIDPRLIYAMPVDMRVVINWDTDNCDIDLWVTDPNGEKCFYSHKETAAGGRISNDFTGGYGPEEFIIKKAIPGDYMIEANYFGSSSQSLIGATTIQVQLTTNYGRSTSQTKEITRRLESQKETIALATFHFDKKK